MSAPRPATRERREKFILSFDATAISRALDTAMHDGGGLSWLTADQIADISDLLVAKERSRTRRNIQNRGAWRAGRVA